ncbi:MAG: hypothetical protein OHK0023_06130 [Anaerolineae bacterium]
MRILYSLPHPADKLGSGAGHVIRASAMLAALESLGHTILRVQAATEGSGGGGKAAVGIYRNVVKKLMPRPLAMRMRDMGRIKFGQGYGRRLIEIIERERPDVILETHIAFSLAGASASEATGVPLVLDDVAPAWEEEQQYGVGLKQAARSIHHDVTGCAKLLVAVNKTLCQYLIDEGQPANKVVVVENGIDDSTFRLGLDGSPMRQKYAIPADAVVIVFVGSFQPYHRVDLLLRAFAKVTAPHVRLLLVGQGQTSAEARALAEQLGVLDRTIFTGSVPYPEVPAHLAAGDIAIMPATNEYGNPMKLYEYMALGKVVVAPDQPTITEIATHSQDSFLFPKEDVEGMAAALNTLAADSALRQRLGDAGSRLAGQHTWRKRAETLTEAMRRVGIG